MNPCASEIFFILQFLSNGTEEQIRYCDSFLPENAYDSLLLPAQDEQEYELYWLEKQGSPLSQIYRQLCEYLPIFSNLPENTLAQDDTILKELECLLNLMVFYKGNQGTLNRFWAAKSLREDMEWRLVRRLSAMALEKLGGSAGIPTVSFEEMIYD
jgi:hypothetical protein